MLLVRHAPDCGQDCAYAVHTALHTETLVHGARSELFMTRVAGPGIGTGEPK